MRPNAPRYLRYRSRRVSTTGPKIHRLSREESSRCLRILHTLRGDRLCYVKESRSRPFCRRLPRGRGKRRGAGRRLNYRSELARGELAGSASGELPDCAGFARPGLSFRHLNLSQRMFLPDFCMMGKCFRLVQAAGRRKGAGAELERVLGRVGCDPQTQAAVLRICCRCCRWWGRR